MWLKSIISIKHDYHTPPIIEERGEFLEDWRYISRPDTNWKLIIDEPDFKVAFDTTVVIFYVKKKR